MLKNYISILFTTIITLLPNSAFAQLKLKKEIIQGHGGIHGLYRVQAITVSPNGENIVAISDAEKSIVHFKQIPETNEIKHVETIYNIDNSEVSFFNPSCMYSSDGKYVYICCPRSGLIRLRHEGVDDKLILDTTFTPSDVPDLKGAYSIIESSDGKFIYVSTRSTYANQDSHIIIFKVDEVTKKITLHKSYDNSIFLKNYEMLKISRDGRFAYGIVDYSLDAGVTLFERDTQDGTLKYITTYREGPANNGTKMVSPDFIQFSPDNRFLFVICGDNYILKYSFNALNGTLELLETISGFPIGDSMWGATNGINAIYFKGDNKAVITTSRDGISLLNYHPENGSFTFNKFLDKDLSILKASGHHVNHACDRIYFTTELEHSISAFEVSDTELVHLSTITDNQNGIDGLVEPSSMCMTADGKFIYITSKDKLAGLRINEVGTGDVSHIQSITEYPSEKYSDIKGLWWINEIVLSPDEKFLYVNIQNYILTYSRNKETGILEFVQELEIPYDWSLERSLVASKNGEFLFIYVHIDHQDHIKCYQRNSNSGELTFRSEISGDFLKSDNRNELKMVISKDDKYLYIGSCSTHPIAVFEFDKNNESFTYTQTIDINSNYSMSITDIVLNAKEDILYASGYSGTVGNIHIFDRNPDTGTLQLRESFPHAQITEANNSKLGFNSIILSPDNKLLYAISSGDSSITVFRILADGNLKHLNTMHSDDLDNCSLSRPSDIILSRENQDVFVTSFVDNRLIQFSPELFLGNDIWACKGDTINITSNLTFKNYYWSNGVIDKDHINIVEEGQYILDAISETGNLESDTINIFYNPLPDINLGNDTILLPDQQLLLFPGNFDKYLWFDGTTSSYYGFTNGGGSNEVYNVWVIVTDTNGCSNTDSLKVSFLSKKDPALKDYLLIPNSPVKQELAISLIDDVNVIQAINIYSTAGNLLATNHINGQQAHFNMTSYTKGIYLVEVIFKDGSPIRRKILKI